LREAKKEASYFNSIKIQGKEDSLMRVLVPLMIQYPSTARYKGMKATYERIYIDEDYFLDGPVTRRIAVLDLCPQSGELLKAIKKGTGKINKINISRKPLPLTPTKAFNLVFGNRLHESLQP
jgi:hypothetical protein